MKNILQSTAVLILTGVAALAPPATADETAPPSTYSLFGDSELAINFGTFGAFQTEQVFEVGLELRLGRATIVDGFSLRPIFGTSILDDGGNYWYLGGRGELPFGHEDAWTLGLSFAPGIYSPGGIDLGGPVEFRSGIDVGHELFAGVNAGVGVYHLSNGGLYSRNGGAESVLFTLSTRL